MATMVAALAVRGELVPLWAQSCRVAREKKKSSLPFPLEKTEYRSSQFPSLFLSFSLSLSCLFFGESRTVTRLLFHYTLWFPPRCSFEIFRQVRCLPQDSRAAFFAQRPSKPRRAKTDFVRAESLIAEMKRINSRNSMIANVIAYLILNHVTLRSFTKENILFNSCLTTGLRYVSNYSYYLL